MIKRTPQEIADFFGCYVYEDSRYGQYEFRLSEARPKISNNEFWDCYYTDAYLLHDLIKLPPDHDWTHLYEPQNMTPESQIINEESDENCQKSGLCPHSGEVYTHKEYIVVHDSFLSELAAKVARHMENGWKLQGGVAIRHPENREDSHTFYQAMVRGV